MNECLYICIYIVYIYIYIYVSIIKCVYECMRVCDELCVTMERSASQETLQVSFNTNSIHCLHIAPSLHSILCLLIQVKPSHNVI